MITNEKILYSVRDVCDLTGLSRSTIYRKISNGSFPNQKQISTRRVGFLKEDIEIWIKELHSKDQYAH